MKKLVSFLFILFISFSAHASGVNSLWQDTTNWNLAVGATNFPNTVSQAGGGIVTHC